jgi:hypothetical protein
MQPERPRGYQPCRPADIWYQCQAISAPRRHRLRIIKLAALIDGRHIVNYGRRVNYSHVNYWRVNYWLR